MPRFVPLQPAAKRRELRSELQWVRESTPVGRAREWVLVPAWGMESVPALVQEQALVQERGAPIVPEWCLFRCLPGHQLCRGRPRDAVEPRHTPRWDLRIRWRVRLPRFHHPFLHKRQARRRTGRGPGATGAATSIAPNDARRVSSEGRKVRSLQIAAWFGEPAVSSRRTAASVIDFTRSFELTNCG